MTRVLHRRNRSCNKMERLGDRWFVSAFEVDLKLADRLARQRPPIPRNIPRRSRRAGFLGERKKAKVALGSERMLSDALDHPRLGKLGRKSDLTTGKFLSSQDACRVSVASFAHQPHSRCIPVVRKIRFACK